MILVGTKSDEFSEVMRQFHHKYGECNNDKKGSPSKDKNGDQIYSEK